MELLTFTMSKLGARGDILYFLCKTLRPLHVCNCMMSLAIFYDHPLQNQTSRHAQ